MRVFRRFSGIARNAPLAVMSFSLITLTTAVVYWQDFAVLANEALENDAMSHLFLIPVFVFYLIYRRRRMLKASILCHNSSTRAQYVHINEIFGLSLCLLALVLYWYGNYTFYTLEYHLVSLIAFVVGVILVLFNLKTLITLIPIISFLIFLIPIPSNLTFSAGALLGNFTAQTAHALLKTIGIPVTLSHEYGPPILTIDDSTTHYFEFAIDIPCSGIYSLIAFVAFAAFIAYIIKGSMLKKATLFSLGFMILSILNVFRISLIISIAYWFGEEIAMTIFHVFSGWILIFLGILLLLVIGERLLHLRIFAGSSHASSCTECSQNRMERKAFCLNCGTQLKSPHLKFANRFWIKTVCLLLISCLVMMSIQAPVFALAQGITITSSDPEMCVDAFPQIAEYQLKFLYRDQNFEKISHQDASLLYAYISLNVSDPTVYVLVQVAGSITNLHSWEVCLVTEQTSRGLAPLATVQDLRDVQLLQNPPITARYFTFQHPSNHTQVTLYWYQKALFRTGITIEPRYTRISLIILTRNANDYPQLGQKLLRVGQTIAAYWEPVKAQSLISLGIPTIQILLVLTTLFAIFLQATQYAKDWRRRKTNLRIFEKLASPKEKLLYQTIKELSQKTKEITAQKITSAFEKVVDKATKLDELIGMLNNLEKNGIVQTDIINIQDQPKLVWKT
ncbi:MAG: exosortase/archaeosortase family protein [Candidatus Bathyarchaeota archaeon]|jgi:exosortase